MCSLAMLIWVLFHPAGERVFTIPAGSMMPTLLIGDYVVMTSAYDEDDPRRGDIAVVRATGDPTSVFNFRVVGLPGDVVGMTGGRLHINGVAVAGHPSGEIEMDLGFGSPTLVARMHETLPNGVSYDVLDADPDGFLDNTAALTVPAGHYFLLGDNRDNAADSRLIDGLGYVPRENFVGRVDRVLCSVAGDGRWRLERAGQPVSR